jgi:uncharacterized membrane protein
VLIAAAALVLPGLALELALVPSGPSRLVRAVRAFLLSLAAWPVAVQATRLPGVRLAHVAWAGVLGGAAAVVLLRRRRRGAAVAGGAAAGGGWRLVALCAAVAALHLLPMRAWLVAPGSDMSAHTLLARLLLEADGVPATYAPLYPFMGFGAYAAGLPATAAVLCRLAGWEAARGALALALLSYPALAGALFLVARRGSSDGVALLAAGATAGACGSYAVLEWGGNPTVLSLALALAAIAPVAGGRLDAVRDDGALASPLLLAGAALVHVIPVVGLAYALAPAAVLWAVQRPRGERARLLLAWAGLAVAAALLGGVPYLLAERPHISAAELAWTAAWQRDTAHAYHGSARDFAWTIWPYLRSRLGGLGSWLAVLALAAALLRRRRTDLAWGAFAAVTLLLVLNSRSWLLPGSAALYPERMVLLLQAPIAALLASGLAAARGAARGRGCLASLGLTAGAALLLVAGPVREVRRRVDAAGRAVAVTPDDLRAMRWMAGNLPADAVVQNEMGDAGNWIPALAFRAVYTPHDNPMYRDELDAWRAGVRPGWLYTGARAVYPVAMDAAAARREPGRYREVFASGAAAVFRLER